MILIWCFIAFVTNRYSGKTQKQIVEFVRENYVKRTTFQRWVIFFICVTAFVDFYHHLSLSYYSLLGLLVPHSIHYGTTWYGECLDAWLMFCFIYVTYNALLNLYICSVFVLFFSLWSLIIRKLSINILVWYFLLYRLFY